MSDVQRDQTGRDPSYAPEVPAGEMEASGGASGPRAGFWRRLGAYLVDFILLGAVSSVLIAILGNTPVVNLITAVIGLAYFTLLEGGADGQTLGKKLLGIRVFDFRHGAGSIGYGRAFVRSIMRYVSTVVFFLGYLWMLWDKEKQTWHDKVASSVVVPVSAYPTGN